MGLLKDKEKIKKNIGRILRNDRRLRGMNQEDYATELLYCQKSKLSDMETNGPKDIDSMLWLIDQTGMSVMEFFCNILPGEERKRQQEKCLEYLTRQRLVSDVNEEFDFAETKKHMEEMCDRGNAFSRKILERYDFAYSRDDTKAEKLLLSGIYQYIAIRVETENLCKADVLPITENDREYVFLVRNTVVDVLENDIALLRIIHSLKKKDMVIPYLVRFLDADRKYIERIAGLCDGALTEYLHYEFGVKAKGVNRKTIAVLKNIGNGE